MTRNYIQPLLTHLPMCAVYSNSLMATLNSRPRRKGTSRAGESVSEVMTSTTLSFHAASGNVTASGNGRRTATPMRSVGSTRTKSYGQVRWHRRKQIQR